MGQDFLFSHDELFWNIIQYTIAMLRYCYKGLANGQWQISSFDTLESTQFGKRNLTPPHFHSTTTHSISYVSFTYIELKFDFLFSLGRSLKLPGSRLKKSLVKNSEICNVIRLKTLLCEPSIDSIAQNFVFFSTATSYEI